MEVSPTAHAVRMTTWPHESSPSIEALLISSSFTSCLLTLLVRRPERALIVWPMALFKPSLPRHAGQRSITWRQMPGGTGCVFSLFFHARLGTQARPSCWFRPSIVLVFTRCLSCRNVGRARILLNSLLTMGSRSSPIVVSWKAYTVAPLIVRTVRPARALVHP